MADFLEVHDYGQLSGTTNAIRAERASGPDIESVRTRPVTVGVSLVVVRL
jgi:hypothetical protein